MSMVACKDCKMLAESELPACPFCGSSNRKSALRAETLLENLVERVFEVTTVLSSINSRSLSVAGPVLGAFAVLVIGGMLMKSIWPDSSRTPAVVTMGARAASHQIKPLEAAFSIAVTRSGNDMIVTGRTNLPPQTHLNVTVSVVAGSPLVGSAQDVTVEPDGVFYGGPFVWAPHEGRTRGKYRVDIVARPVERQPNSSVRAMAGHDRSNSAGSLDRRSAAGEKKNPEVRFEFDYDGSENFSFWIDAPANARKPPLNVSWTKDSLASLISAKRDLTLPSSGAPTAAIRFSSGGRGTRIMLVEHYGCVDKEYLNPHGRYGGGSRQRWGEELDLATVFGQCILFAPGDEVVVDDAPASEGMIKVRRPGRAREYWVDAAGTD